MPKLRLLNEPIEIFHIKQLATKSEVWSYEDGYRIVKSKASRITIKYPKEMIQQIFLGCNLRHKEKMEIIDFVKEQKIKCEIYKLSLDKEDFQLNQSRIF